MFQHWSILGDQWFVLSAGFAAFALGVFPVAHHLIFGNRERRREILGFFTPGTVKLYFQEFYESEFEKIARDPSAALRQLYDQRFGARTFALPFILYGLSLLILIGVIVVSILHGPIRWGGATLELKGLYALAGAYLWVTFDLISGYRQRNLTPSALYWYAFRFLISIPLAYAISSLLTETAAAPIAFALGAFPTTTLMLFLRRQASQRLGLGNDADTQKLELEALQGVNTALAEKFSEIGITTLLQLAYEDPIQLTMRTNLSFSYVVDLVSQALATVYGLRLEIARPYALRGAIEAAEAFDHFMNGTDVDKARAATIIRELATKFQVPDAVVQQMLCDIGKDGYTTFLRKMWDGEARAT